MPKLFIGPNSRECGNCHEVKPFADFTQRGTVKGAPVYKSACKVCAAARMRKWAKDNAAQHATTRHAWDLRNIYGITPEIHAAMLAEQGGKCAICGEDEKSQHWRNGTPFRLSVDHCHATGKVRGLLCQRCNRAIGLFGDSSDLLRKAIGYLERR